jgi:uncharacterized repeat protein (TIGR03803 family)
MLSKTGGLFTVLHNFSGGITDGEVPYAGVFMGTKGNLYGVTLQGGGTGCEGGDGCGVAYKLSNAGKLTVLHSFTGGTTDGCYPLGTPAMDKDENLYGTTEGCGSYGSGGTVWKLRQEGTETVLHNFTGPPDGAQPESGVIIDAKGNLYGDTSLGGNAQCYSQGCGTVYKLDKKDVLTVLHSFTESDGVNPLGGPIQDSKGNLYGTAVYGGSGGGGTVWKLALEAIVSLSPTRLDFGNQTVDISSVPQVVTLTNTGNINLNITSIKIAGTNSGDFSQTNNCGKVVPPNGTCDITVTFTPSTTGTRNAAVSITDNAPGSPQSVPLTGVGVLPAVTFSPTSLTFPTQVIFTTSKSQPVQLANNGLGILLITKIEISGPFAQTNNCPSSLKPGAYCTIDVEYRSRQKGVQTGSLSVTDNVPGSPQEVPLKGTCTYVQLVPASLNFGTQPVDTESLPRGVTLTNKGDAPVNIVGITINGADVKDFAETNNCGKQVASGTSCFIKVTFKPLMKGKRTADVSVHDSGGGSPQEVALEGTGT